MNTLTIDPTSPTRDAAKKLAIVKHLAGGKSLDVTATIVNLDRSVVLDVGSRHGYPDTDKLAWAADVLEKKAAEVAAAGTVKTGPLEHGVRVNQPHPVAVAAARPSPSPASTSTPGQAAAGSPTEPDGIEALLARAEAHPGRRIVNAAAKVRADLARLEDLLAEDEAKNAAKRKAAAEKEKAKAEVERLKEQLAQAQAKLRGGPAKTTKTKRTVVKQDMTCDDCGKEMHTNEAGMRMHRMRAHSEQAAS